MIAEMIPQVSSIAIIHDQMQMLPILERINHIHQKRMLQLNQQLPFIHHRVDRSLRHDFHLLHLLHRINDLRGFLHHLPHLAKAALSDHKDEVKIIGVGFGLDLVLDAAAIEAHSFGLQTLHVVILEFLTEFNILDALKINMTI